MAFNVLLLDSKWFRYWYEWKTKYCGSKYHLIYAISESIFRNLTKIDKGEVKQITINMIKIQSTISLLSIMCRHVLYMRRECPIN